jgi:hypothetical protein
MPQVPYSGAPEVSSQLDPLPNPQVNTSIDAFGGAVAGAVSHVGEAMQGAGKELMARAIGFQEINEQVKADQASADVTDLMNQRYLDYDKLKGDERIAGSKQYVDDLAKIRNDGAAGLESPYAKQKYLNDTRRLQSQMIWHGAVLARQGQDEATLAAAHGKMNAAVNNYGTVNPDDDKAFFNTAGQIKQDAANLVHSDNKLGGFAPGTPENNNAAAPIVSSKVSQMILAKMSADPAGAKALKAKALAAKLLTPDDSDKLDGRIENAVDNKLGRKIGLSVATKPEYKGRVPDAIKAAGDEAEKADPGNTVLKSNAQDAAEGRIVHETNLEKAAFQETLHGLQRGIDGTDSGGKVPLTLEEAQQDPNWRKMYESAPEEIQGQVRKQLMRNQTTDGWIPNEEGTRQYQNLYSVLSDPTSSAAEVDAALNTNLLKTSMTREQRTGIQNKIFGVLKDQGNPANVNSALNVAEVRSAMRDAGLQKGTDEYDKFVEEYTTAIGEFAQGAHRTVKDHKQLGEIASNMLTANASSWYNPMSWGGKSLYQNIFEVRPDLKAQAVGSWKRRYGTVPTEDQLQELAPAFYKEYFQQLGAKSRPSAGKIDTRATP